MYRIHNFFFKLKRAWGWFLFSFRQDPWQEDYQLFETIEKVLLDTAKHFEKLEKRGVLFPADNKDNIADMRLAAKLIRMRMDEYYWSEACKEGYNFQRFTKATEKDQKALEIAMKIITTKGFYWWI